MYVQGERELYLSSTEAAASASSTFDAIGQVKACCVTLVSLVWWHYRWQLFYRTLDRCCY